MPLEYRKLKPYESRIYREIRLESLKKFPEAFEADYQDALRTEKLRFEIDIENQETDRFIIGAFYGNELIGICGFVKDEGGRGNIFQMYVKEEYQGRNIGMELLRAVINDADTKEIILEVKPDNLSAFHLYQKAGFKETECHPGSTGIRMQYTK
ncbi:GNAT family N-acetyltransferase [Elizabethkingia meningoseptica]|uniref:GNAT family N-acetyltransferase n=1 Tax=Elizabethkingia meningoseptica TaxID=238 RepID=UPI003891670D